jgi:hypothetical protein
MNALRQALVDYLAMRRVLGYELARAEKRLAQFLTYLEDRSENHVTTETALAWATLPPGPGLIYGRDRQTNINRSTLLRKASSAPFAAGH